MPRKKPRRRAKTTGRDARSKIVRKSKSADARRTKKGRLLTTATLAKIGAVRVATKVDLGSLLGAIAARHPAEFRIPFRRPDDLLICDFVFENLQFDLEEPGAPKLVRKDPQAAATLTVEFPPQSFGEEAFLDATGKSVPGDRAGNEKFPEKVPKENLADPNDQNPPPGKLKPKNVVQPGDSAEQLRPMPSAKIRMSGRSRIAFTMRAEETELPFTIEAILDACRRWPMRLDVNAVPDPSPFRFPLSEFGVQD